MNAQPQPKPAPIAKTSSVRVLVVDDHAMLRVGLTNLVNRQSDMTCCGDAADISTALHAITTQKPDMALVDLCLGEEDGLDLVKKLKADWPQIRVLVLSQMDETIYAERCLRAGSHGYVMKEQAADELLRAIRTVLSGNIYVSEKIAALAVRRMIEERPPARETSIALLTDREKTVLKSVAQGKPNREIAAELHLSVKTIETYREHLKYKLGLATAAELGRFADQWLQSQAGPPSESPIRVVPNQIPLSAAQ